PRGNRSPSGALLTHMMSTAALVVAVSMLILGSTSLVNPATISDYIAKAAQQDASPDGQRYTPIVDKRLSVELLHAASTCRHPHLNPAAFSFQIVLILGADGEVTNCLHRLSRADESHRAATLLGCVAERLAKLRWPRPPHPGW